MNEGNMFNKDEPVKISGFLSAEEVKERARKLLSKAKQKQTEVEIENLLGKKEAEDTEGDITKS